MRLEEKEKREKEILKQIIEEAEEYKDAFYKKRVVSCENKKLSNRESELVRVVMLYCSICFAYVVVLSCYDNLLLTYYVCHLCLFDLVM